MLATRRVPVPLRVPPGRSGRPWLAHRLALARRGAEVLDQKRRVLLAEVQRSSELVRATRARWEEAQREATRWLSRAVLLGGERQLRLAAGYVTEAADVRIGWRHSMGVVFPGEADVRVPELPDLSALGMSAALLEAGASHRRAVEAALRYAAAQVAHRRLSEELRLTVRRLRATEKRWIPLHEQALATLELVLDEGEREDAARTRWAVGRLRMMSRSSTTSGAGPAPAERP